MSKKLITNKQKTILTLLYIFRFLNSKQIQEFLNHKDHRRINSWLKDLTDKEYIERDFTPVFGTLTKPAVYFLTTKGRTMIKDLNRYHYSHYLKRISRDNKASKAFKIKCQIIADCYLLLHDSPENRLAIVGYQTQVLNTTDEEFTEQETIPLNKTQFFTSAYYPDFVLLESMKQDAYIRKKTTKGINHGLLFVVDAYVPRFLMRYTVQKIFETLNEEYWEDEEIHKLDVYFLCPNNQIIIYLRRVLPTHLQNYYGSKLLSIHLTTRNQLYKKKSGIINKIPWITMTSEDEFG